MTRWWRWWRPEPARPPTLDRVADVGRDQPPVRLTAWVRGSVQGVGFRWWTRSRALELGLVGWVRNLEDGRVEVVVEGPPATCERMLAALAGPGTPGNVTGVTHRWATAQGVPGRFTAS